MAYRRDSTFLGLFSLGEKKKIFKPALMKGTEPRDFVPLFLCPKTLIWIAKKPDSRNFFVLAKIFDSKVRNSRDRLVYDFADTEFYPLITPNFEML